MAAVISGWGFADCAAEGVFGSAPEKKSTFSESVKSGFNKVGNFFTPSSHAVKTDSPDDAVSLQNNAEPSPALYLAIARLYEQSHNASEAEANYRKALQEDPKDLKALLSYGRFKERLGETNAALAIYQNAVTMHPREAAAHNHLGIFWERQGKHEEAVREIALAVKFEPRNLRYRNNYAAMLVENNRLEEAFTVLRQVHGDAAAYYNIGYLLQKKGETASAEHHFVQALRADPRMVPAQRWLNYLHNQDREKRQAERPPQYRQASRMSGPPTAQNFPARTASSPPSRPTPTAPRQTWSASPDSSVVPIAPPQSKPAYTWASDQGTSRASPGAAPSPATSPIAASRRGFQQAQAQPPRTTHAPPNGSSGVHPRWNTAPPATAPLQAPISPPDPPELETPKRLPPVTARATRRASLAESAPVELTSHSEELPSQTPTAPLPPE
ncbi:MAG: tetratricopeptide repeat protein [Pirellulales bacterium]|nr:tetratricopeptide repeat protein [Pirellulales bacterium]